MTFRVTRETAKIREVWKCYAAGFEGEGRGHEPRNAGSFSKLQGNRCFSLEPSKEMQAWWHLDFVAQWDLFWNSGLQNCTIINVYCFKTLSLWWCVTTAIGNCFCFFIVVILFSLGLSELLPLFLCLKLRSIKCEFAHNLTFSLGISLGFTKVGLTDWKW